MGEKAVMHVMDEMGPRFLMRERTMRTLARRVDAVEGGLRLAGLEEGGRLRF